MNKDLDLDVGCNFEEFLNCAIASPSNIRHSNNSMLDVGNNKLLNPLSPCDSLDSGVGSSGSDLTSSPDPSLNISPSLEISDFSDINEIFNTNLDQLDSPASDPTNQLIDNLDFEVIINKPPFASQEFYTVKDDLLSEARFFTVKTIIPETINVSPLELPKVTIKSSLIGPIKTPKSRCGRKSKAISSEEKKQRKRDQNKNAAIRYREKKREEAEKRNALFNSLDSKNKGLKDKVNQISREINYLKDLKIEVYKAKGLIS